MGNNPAPETPQRPVLLVSGGAPTQPLWPLLAETYDLAFLYPQAAQQAQAQGLPAAALGALWDGQAQETTANVAVQLAARVVTALPAIGERVADAYAGAPPPMLNGALGDWFAGYAHSVLSGPLAILAQLEKLASTGRQIAGCVTHEDVAPDTRTLVNWCNARSIPTIHVPHAPCHLLPGVTDIHRETRATWIAASGPAMAEFYAEAGHDPAHIVVTGGPQYDGLYGARPGREEARRVLDAKLLPEFAGPVLCYMTTWGQTTSLRSDFDREFATGWQAMLGAAKALGAYLMVLVHWHDGRAGVEEQYEAAMVAAGVPGLVTRNHKLYVLAAADLLVAQGPSNMTLDAAIMGVPSVYLQTEGFDFRTPLPRRCAPEKLADAIAAALSEPVALDEFVAQYNVTHATQGGATENVVAMVRQLCP